MTDVQDKADVQATRLDSQTMTELQELLGADKFKLLLETFIESSSTHVETIKASVTNQDFDTLHIAAHSLKGSSANMGGKMLAEMCLQMEQQAKMQNSEHLGVILQGVTSEHQQMIELLKQYL